VHSLILFAAETSEKAEPDKTAFYIAAGLAVVWALSLFAIGMRKDGEWPGDQGTARVIMIISALLVAATMISAVATG
jgi:hypothetical protein